jgi:hypothetical protein
MKDRGKGIGMIFFCWTKHDRIWYTHNVSTWFVLRAMQAELASSIGLLL